MTINNYACLLLGMAQCSKSPPTAKIVSTSGSISSRFFISSVAVGSGKIFSSAYMFLGRLFPGGYLKSYFKNRCEKRILIIALAKNRPGHPYRPAPKCKLPRSIDTSWYRLALSGLDVSSRLRANRKPSNSEGSPGITSGSCWIGSAARQTWVPAGKLWFHC